jgi:ketosteroid isomerase-like protein
MTDDAITEIKRQEAARGRALVSADWPALAALVADDVVHIHATGQIDDKAQYMEGLRTKFEFIKVERDSLHVRCYGDFAIATGILTQTIRLKGPGTVLEMRAATTQTWIQKGNRWVQNSFQATRIA